jgi:hypothetical protein
MPEILVQDTLLTKVVTFVQHAAPELEKTAAEKAAFAQQVPVMIDSMISAGVLESSNRDAAIKNLTEGGLAKCAELVPFLAGRVTSPSMGQASQGSRGGQEKRAGYAQPRNAQKESDRIWVEGITA